VFVLWSHVSPFVQLPQGGEELPHAFVMVPHEVAPQVGVGQKH
jgi:hypothetical protein